VIFFDFRLDRKIAPRHIISLNPEFMEQHTDSFSGLLHCQMKDEQKYGRCLISLPQFKILSSVLGFWSL